jgi:Putative zinc-finger
MSSQATYHAGGSMDCSEAANTSRMEEYLAGRMSATDQDQFEIHLLECQPCTTALEALLLLRSEVARNQSAIRAKTAGNASFFSRRNLFSVAFATLILVFGFAAYQKLSQETQQPIAVQSHSNSSLPQVTAGTSAETSALQPGTPAVTSSPVISGKAANANPKPQTPEGNSPAPTAQTSEEIAANPQPYAPPNTIAPGATELPEVGPYNSSSNNSPGKSKLPSENNAPAKTLTTQQGVELFKLSHVQPPAYSFAGLGNSKFDPGHASTGYGDNRGPNGMARAKFQKAMNSYMEGHYLEAADILKSARELEPKAADINFYLGVSLVATGHPADAVEPLETAIAANNPLYLQRSHFYLGKTYLQLQQLDGAIQEFDLAATAPGTLNSTARDLSQKVHALRDSIKAN